MKAMKMDLRQKTVKYMKRRGLSRAEMARLIGKETAPLAKYLDGIPISPGGREWVEAALEAFFYRLEQRKSRRPKKFINLTASKLVLERCEEARAEGELVLLYGTARPAPARLTRWRNTCGAGPSRETRRSSF